MSTLCRQSEKALSKQFGQLGELVAVRAFDEDVIAFRAVAGDGGLHFLDVVELAEGAGDVAEVVAHKPDVVVAGRLEIADELAMLLVALFA